MIRLSLLSAVFLVFFTLGCQSLLHKTEIPYNKNYGEFIVSSRQKNDSVILIPQWSGSTHDIKKRTNEAYPQKENQWAIYNQIIEWNQAGIINTVLVEGCEGEIQDNITSSTNDSSIFNLKILLLSDKSIDDINTDIGLKLKAHLGDKIKVLCGDDLKLSRQLPKALSDFKELFNLKFILKEYEKNNQFKSLGYIEVARKKLNMPANTTDKEVLVSLENEIRSLRNAYKKIIFERNRIFAQHIKQEKKPLAIIIGAIHIQDLKEQLPNENVDIFKPKGLDGDEYLLMEKADEILESE